MLGRSPGAGPHEPSSGFRAAVAFRACAADARRSGGAKGQSEPSRHRRTECGKRSKKPRLGDHGRVSIRGVLLSHHSPADVPSSRRRAHGARGRGAFAPSAGPQQQADRRAPRRELVNDRSAHPPRCEQVSREDSQGSGHGLRAGEKHAGCTLRKTPADMRWTPSRSREWTAVKHLLRDIELSNTAPCRTAFTRIVVNTRLEVSMRGDKDESPRFVLAHARTRVASMWDRGAWDSALSLEDDDSSCLLESSPARASSGAAHALSHH